MIKPNNPEGNSQLLGTQNTLSNTHLFLHLPLTLTTNSFNSFLSTSNKANFKLPLLNIHLDYLRISTTIYTKKSLDNLLANLGLPIPKSENRISWHPDKTMPKSKKYQNSIQSDTGIKLGYTKRLKDKSKKPKYVYDIMIDFYGCYFADITLLEQINLIDYLNSNYKLKCHRIDVAMDDYSRELFPILKILVAYEMGNYFGFNKTNEDYLYCISDGCIGTLALGSRLSEHYVRIYTLHKYFDRWETELKRNKSQNLFDKLARLAKNKVDNNFSSGAILKALSSAALDKINFRDKSQASSFKNATKERTKRLSFWQTTSDKIHSAIENQADYNWLINSLNKS